MNRLFYIAILAICLPLFAFAEGEQSLEAQLKTLTKIENNLPTKQTIHNLTDNSKTKKSLIDIRDNAITQQKLFELEIEKSTALLNTLTVEATDDLSEKDKTVIAQRKLLEEDLVKSSASLKKTRLIEAQAKKLLSQISSLNADTFSDFILQKLPSPIMPSNFVKLKEEVSNITFDFNYNILLIIALILVAINITIMFFSRKIYAIYLNIPAGEEAPKVPFKKRLVIIFSLLVIAYSLYFYLGTEEKSPYTVSAILFVCYMVVAPVLYSLLGKIKLLPKEEKIDGDTVYREKKFLKLVLRVSRLLLLSVPILLLLGYIILGAYITFNIALTVVAIILFVFLRTLAERTLCYFKPEKNASLSAMSIVLVELVLGIGLFVFVANFWGFSLQSYADLYESHKNGITIGDTSINFKNIIFAVLGFFIALYIFRFVQWFFKERIFKRSDTKKSSGEAMISIIGYLGIAVACITGLSILGLKTEDLALVVGALSLGIGFGLQNVINNFVSGLILLFERPVKIGDWVKLDSGLEGNIKRIRIRSTELETFQRASVIIPNSDLISKSITNWTLRDPIGRLEIKIGVAYGCDTKKVKEILLGIVNEHSSIRKTPLPRVLFREFGDSSLNFELRCFIRNIDDKALVESDLRFKIDELFRKNKIEIPFPQRDIHIKSGDIK